MSVDWGGQNPGPTNGLRRSRRLGRGYRLYRFYLPRFSNHAQGEWKRLFSLPPGKLLNARVITIWTDVDGVLSADPGMVSEVAMLVC